MQIENVSKRYGIPKEEISCPDCGRVYGHHNTFVCHECERCSKCCEELSCINENSNFPHNFVSAKYFIEFVLNIKPI